MRANFARPDIRENEEASTGFDRRGANTRIIYWSSLSRIIIPRGMHFAGKLTDQYLIPTRTASRRERVSGRQSFKNAERFRVSRGCCCWWFAGGFLRETRISLEGVAHFCLLGWPPGCVIVDIIPATCWRTRRVLASTKNNLERDAGNTATGVFPHKESADRGTERRRLEDRTPQSRSRGTVREDHNEDSRRIIILVLWVY